MNKPKIVCLCGSTRFAEAYKNANREETLKGYIVLSVGLLGHQEGIDMTGPVKQMLDELHLQKIDLADEVLVLNPTVLCHSWCGKPIRMMTDICYRCDECKRLVEDRVMIAYIGESTRREIAYATEHGKPVRYLNQPEEQQ